MGTSAPHHATARTVAGMAIHVDRARTGQGLLIQGFTDLGRFARNHLGIRRTQMGLLRTLLMVMCMVTKVL